MKLQSKEWFINLIPPNLSGMIGEIYLGDLKSGVFKLTDEYVREGIALVTDYSDSIINSVINDLRSLNYPVRLYDFNGLWSSNIKDASIISVGIDFKFNPFLNPEYIPLRTYASILEALINEILFMHGFKDYSWRYIFQDLITTILTSKDVIPDLDTLFKELEVLRNESSGFEKMAYTKLYYIVHSLFSGSDFDLFNTDSRFKNLNPGRGNIVIYDFSVISNLYTRMLIYLIILFNNLFLKSNYPIYSLNSLRIVLYDVKSRNQLLIIQSRIIPRDIPFKYILIKLNYLARHYKDSPKVLGILFQQSSHLMISPVEVIPLRIREGLIMYSNEVETFKQYEGEHIESIDKDLAIKILSVVSEYQEIGPEGICIHLQGYDRGLIYSHIDWLWRRGFLRREPRGGRFIYKLSVKGLLSLKKGVINSE